MIVEPASERIFQLGDLGPHPALGHVRENNQVALPDDQRVDHLAARFRQHRRRDRRQLHARILKDLVEALRFTATFLNHRLAIASQVTLLTGRAWRNERRTHQAMLDQTGTPLRIADVGLTARNVTHMPRVD